MAGGWIAKGPDQPAPATPSGPAPAPQPQPQQNAIDGKWSTVGADAPAQKGWVATAPDRPLDPHAYDYKPAEDTRGTLQKIKDTLMGSDEKPGAPATAGILPAINHSWQDFSDRVTNSGAHEGPGWDKLAESYPHILAAKAKMLSSGYQEAVGASQVQSAEQQLAVLNVLPQVAARTPGNEPADKIPAMAQDPLVKATAIKLGMDPLVFAGQYAQVATMNQERQADAARSAQQTLQDGQDSVTSGRNKRLDAAQDARTWTPTDSINGQLDPWTMKGLAFNTAVGIPELAAVTGATVVGTAVAGPGGGIAAGGFTAAALFAPQQRAQVKNQIEQKVTSMLDKADSLDQTSGGGQKNPITDQLRQQAADLAANSDKIANTAGVLYAIADTAGATPISAVLSKTPAAQAVLDRIVGAAITKTAGGRIAGGMIANGAGGVVQAALNQAIDSGVVHNDTKLSDALKDIAYTGVVSAMTALPIMGAHEAAGAPGRASAQRNLDADALKERIATATSKPFGPDAPAPGEDYPGYRWNPDAPNPSDSNPNAKGKYEPTGANAETNAPAKLGFGSSNETSTADSETPAGPAGPSAADTYKAKIDALNTAASKADKRSDVTLEPEEEGWSIHVKGQQVATFDSVANAREAMAQARKLVGTGTTAAANTPDTGSTESHNSPPEGPLERTQPIQTPFERRSNADLRGRVDQMDPDQLRSALLTHELTGIPNRRAYAESDKKPAQASIDVDSLKWINDNAGHPGGDELLKTVAQALHEESGGNAFHISGDEFAVQGDSQEALESTMARAKDRLAGATLTFAHPDGRTVELKGVGLSHGTGRTLEEADANLAAAKQGRQSQGLRAARGEQPPGASITSGKAGLQTGQGAPTAEVLGQEVTPPAQPTPAQAQAGNYAKPEVSWHGLPIKLENLPGSKRPFTYPDGRKGSRTMKAPYGYFPGHTGADGDGVDVFTHPGAKSDSGNAYVIDQLNGEGTAFDEHKVVVGAPSAAAAKNLYLEHYQKGWKGFGAITRMQPEQLKTWLDKGDLTAPLAWKAPKPRVAPPIPRSDATKDSILQYLAKHPRGIDREEAAAQGIDPADMKQREAFVGIRSAFRKGGMTFDEAAEHLHESGFPVADSQGHYNPNTLLERISDELHGHPSYSVHNQAHTEALAAEEAERKLMSEDAAARHIAPGVPDLEHEPQEVIDWVKLADEARKVDPDAVERALERDDDQAVKAELEGIVARGREAEGKLAGGAAKGEGAPAPLRSHPSEEELLESYTEEELAARARAGDESAKAALAADVKHSIDKDLGSFELTGSARASDSNPRQVDLLNFLREPEAKYSNTAVQEARSRSPTGSPRQMDIFANVKAPQAASDASRAGAAQIKGRVKLRAAGTFKSGFRTIDTWRMAAHVLAPIRKSPQEVMAALVLDKDKKPIAVLKHSLGTINSAPVEAFSLVGAIAQVPGAHSVYLAHNHPSGRAELSGPDMNMTKLLDGLMAGSGIHLHGMMVVAHGSDQAQFHSENQGQEIIRSDSILPGTRAATRASSVPTMERFRTGEVTGKNPALGKMVTGPTDAATAVAAANLPSGILFLDGAHRVRAVMPMEAEAMKTLRTGDKATGTAHILRTVAESNTHLLIPFGPLEPAARRNWHKFANASALKILDILRKDSDGDWSSLRGSKSFTDDVGPDRAFLARSGETGAGLPAAQIKYAVNRILENFAVKPKDVVVAPNAAALLKDPEVGSLMSKAQVESAVGFFHPRTGKIYLIADQIHSMDQLAGVVAHEYVVHFGLRSAFGSPRDAQYQAILDGVKKAMPAEVAMRGRAEVGAGYDPGRTSHTNIGAEEALAYYAQQYSKGQSVPSRMRRFIDRLIGMIRDLYRRLRGKAQKFDEQFVKSTLSDLETYLRRGDKAATPESGIEPQFSKPADTFYSSLAKAVDAAKREKGTGAEWEATLRNMPGVKQEEINWVGLKDWLEGRGRVTKDEVADYIDAHRVQLGEVNYGGNGKDFEKTLKQIKDLGYRVEEDVHGDPELVEDTSGDLDIDLLSSPEEIDRANAEKYSKALELMHQLQGGDNPNPKYAQWATPGGENYRELLMTLPQSQEDVGATQRAQKSAAARLKAETDSRLYERQFLDFLPSSDQVLWANARHWLYDAAAPRGHVLRDEAIAKLHNAVDAMSAALRPDARHAMQKAVTANRILRDAQQEDNAAQELAKNGGQYRSGHWDVPNILAHVRFDDRTGPTGEKILHIHEVQSDWHQAGRREGYRPQKEAELAKLVARRDEIEEIGRQKKTPVVFDSKDDIMGADIGHPDAKIYSATGPSGQLISVMKNVASPGWSLRIDSRTQGNFETPQEAMDWVRNSHLYQLADVSSELKQEWAAAINRIQELGRGGVGVPDAPFKTSWPELAMKRMLRMAVEGGYDKLTWDTGDTNADRYNMQSVVDKIRVQSHQPGKYSIYATKGAHTVREEHDLTDERLAALIGKDGAQKAISQLETGIGSMELVGDDLKVGGAGMRGFYDDILPKTMQKLVKKWGASVGRTRLNTGEREIETEGEEGYSSRTVNDRLPVHSVDITQAMRDSVMGGQPMFLKKQPGGAAPAKGKGAVKAGYELARKAVAAIPGNEFTMAFRRIADPSGVSDYAKVTANVTRAALGELAQHSEDALQQLQKFAKTFDLLSKEDSYAFIDAMEEGKRQPIPEHQPAADTIRAVLDHWREQIQGLGIGALENFYENYFPHIWADPPGAKKAFAKIFGRRPLKGPASFLKQRTYATTKEGLEAGLTPISTNPLILAFAKIREMQRFYTGVKLMQTFKEQGLAKFVPAHKRAPEGMTQINDAVGTVKQWSEAEQGFIIRGGYYMPDDAARVINNHLGVSALANFLPARLFRSLTNVITPLQLSFSAFHLGFTTLDAVVSKVALGVERMVHGEPLQAAKAFLEGSTFLGAAGMNIRRGVLLRRAYTNVGAANPLMQKIVAGFIAAGGRIKMDNYYAAGQGKSPFTQVGFTTLAHEVKAALTQPHGKIEAVGKAVGNFPREYATRLWRDLGHIWREASLPVLETPLEVAGRTVRASTAIIMEQIVPLQKLGVFSDLAADHIRRNPDEPQEAFAAAMQRIWDSVDNRLGELVYDNLFWNRTFKDVSHMSVRAVGWNLGTVRELGGAPIDVLKLIDYMARGAPPEDPAAGGEANKADRMAYEHAKSTWQRVAEKVGHKIPYTIALLGVTMTLGAILNYLLTGEGPKEMKDYFFPRTGRLTKYGTPERISLPSYVKDLYEYGTQPMTTVINKANPTFGIIHALYANEDFFGDPTRGIPGKDSVWSQILQGAQYSARAVLPFAIQGQKQFGAAGEGSFRGKILGLAPYVGLTPAPARVTSPEQMDAYQLRETEKAYIRGLYRKLKAATEKGDPKEMDRIRGLLRENKLDERDTERKIKEDKVKARDAAKTIGALVDGKSKTEAVAALKAAGFPAFATLWNSLPDRPRPRVAESLEAFA
jgi:GGDEF domain-containing protein